MEYGCIGEHLPHSFSKEIHEEIGGYAYELRELRPEKVGPFLQKGDFKAINVTIPYKQTVIPYLSGIDETAAAIGAVNTVVNRGGKLYGYNTDFYGMTALIKEEGMEIAGKKVLVLGTGGTSKTACAVAKSLGAKQIVRVSRTARPDAVTYEEAYARHADAQVIVNTTPVGMFPHAGASPIELRCFEQPEAVLDAVYNPLNTVLVLNALKSGVKARTGLYMLVAQAVRAYEIFMDVAAEPGLTDRIYRKILRSKQNIVLIGMPGSGKSTVGKLLARRLCRPFTDTDALIVERAGKEISDIFAGEGEAYFRKLETQAIASFADTGGAVIATGGGAVLKEENLELLRRNSVLFFLDRDPALLVPTGDRPLASTKTAVYNRYHERYPVYLQAADEVIVNNGTPEAAADEIERRFNA